MAHSISVPTSLSVLLLGAAVFFVADSQTCGENIITGERCLVIAHRGFSHIAPENTLAAATLAIQAGANGCEFDVYSSADGHIVAMHDDTVDRTTNGKGKITKLTLAQIKQLDAGSWKDPKFAGEPVPTLQEMLAKLKNTGCHPVIEIKQDGLAERVVAAVRAAGMVHQSVVISFHMGEVKAVRGLEPALPCAWLCGEFPKELPPAKRVAWLLDHARECNTDFVDLGHKVLSKEIIAALHKQKLVVWTWTIDNPVTLRELLAWGVDGITTNWPTIVRDVMRTTAADTTESSAASPAGT